MFAEVEFPDQSICLTSVLHQNIEHVDLNLDNKYGTIPGGNFNRIEKIHPKFLIFLKFCTLEGTVMVYLWR